MTALDIVLCLVLAQRVAELLLAWINTRRLRALGAIEVDPGGYPLFVLLHAAWLASLALAVPAATAPNWPLLGIFALLQPARLWVIASLGRRWSTRIMVLPGAELVRSGAYRYCRHPNYLIVAIEILVLPLVFGAVAIAVIFSAANLLLLARRIGIEERVLAQAGAAMPAAPCAGGPPAIRRPAASASGRSSI